MRTKQHRAAIYARLSYESREGQAEATLDRQERDCRALAKREGWEVVEVFTDVDSAYSGKKRPGYEAMREAARRGEFDVLVVWRTDRLYRRVRDLLDIVDGLASQVRIETVNGGQVDLSTADGRLKAGLLAQVGEHESAVKGERVAARIRQRATQELRPAAGGRRQFGWLPLDEDPDRPGRPRPGGRSGWTLHPTEAPVLAEAYQRVARGESISGVTRWLNDQGMTGTSGQPFRVNTVRSMLTSPRQAGLVVYKGSVVGEASDGLRVIDIGTWQQVQAIIASPTKDRRVRERTLLAGLCRCDCGGVFSSSTKDQGDKRVPILRCRECGMSRRKALTEPLVVEAVAVYLDRNRSRLLKPTKPSKDDPSKDLAQVEADLAALDGLLASGAMRPEAYARASSSLLSRRDEVLARLTSRAGRPATAALLALDKPDQAWRDLVESDVAMARAVLAEVVESVHIARPAVVGKPQPEDVSITWK
jgi:DNA invertase Pin-like site-specific DNA recombinase